MVVVLLLLTEDLVVFFLSDSDTKGLVGIVAVVVVVVVVLAFLGIVSWVQEGTGAEEDDDDDEFRVLFLDGMSMSMAAAGAIALWVPDCRESLVVSAARDAVASFLFPLLAAAVLDMVGSVLVLVKVVFQACRVRSRFSLCFQAAKSLDLLLDCCSAAIMTVRFSSTHFRKA